MTTILPLDPEDLTPEWLSDALEVQVDRVVVLDRHSGTTGRVRLALHGAPGTPPTVFVKLAPFDETQRRFVNEIGMGVAEARFYRDLAYEVDVRVPRAWFAEFDGGDSYVMVLEDLEASDCRFPTHSDTDIEARTRDIVAQLARLHAPYWESDRFDPNGDLDWLAAIGTGRGDGGAAFVRMAIERYADRLPDGFLTLAELYVERSVDVLELYREGERTLVHGDPHLGNLFVDGERTGFLDWAMLGRAPGIRDVAYVLCGSIPTETRRASERELVTDYCARLKGDGIVLDPDVAWEQYRLFAVYSWCSATCTVAMGSKWQPEHVGLGGTTRSTLAAADLDCIGLLQSRLGI
ncbi:MAG: phosphotransferase family protein [Actinomycetota bacterium]